jgi:hypothetical protein
MFLTEAIDHSKIKEVDHAEDLPLRQGPAGFKAVSDTLLKTHDYLSGRRPADFSISQKLKGDPSIVFGRVPESDNFFVATASSFSKTPKINLSLADIEKNYKKSPGLVKKLSHAFNALKDVAPKKGVFQGDIMYTPEDIKSSGNSYSFSSPSGTSYSVNKDTMEGNAVKNSTLGIVVHAEYKGPDLMKMRASFNVNQKKFNSGSGVNFIDPSLNSSMKYTPSDEKDFAVHLLKARQLNQDMIKNGAYNSMEGHEGLLMGYIDRATRLDHPLSTSGYISYIKLQHGKTLNDPKKDKVKLTSKDVENTIIKDALSNKTGLEDIFKLHSTLKDAKNVLVKAMSSSSGSYKSSAKSGGFVVTNNKIPMKFADRKIDAEANKNNPTDKMENSMVFSFARMNPPTIGHAKLVQKVRDTAREIGANHKIVMSATEDSVKNPLSPEQKLNYAKTAFPDTNIEVAGEKEKTIMAQLKKLSMQGVRHLTVVVGDDRKDNFEKIINKYNGKEGQYNFKRINFISAGKRDPKAKDASGVSATKAREAVKMGDFKKFRSTIPKTIDNKAAKRMFGDIKTKYGVGQEEAPPDIGPSTPGISLARYAKHSSDRIAPKAKSEIERRRKAGTWKGQ